MSCLGIFYPYSISYRSQSLVNVLIIWCYSLWLPPNILQTAYMLIAVQCLICRLVFVHPRYLRKVFLQIEYTFHRSLITLFRNRRILNIYILFHYYNSLHYCL